jgi:hypothetical protein
MDAAGAKELAEQAHWRQAEAVRAGHQPPTDPDALELEEIRDGFRYYGRDHQQLTVDGRPAIVTFRLVKTLVDGWWERSAIREEIEYAS